jgi:hypothetical protein
VAVRACVLAIGLGLPIDFRAGLVFLHQTQLIQPGQRLIKPVAGQLEPFFQHGNAAGAAQGKQHLPLHALETQVPRPGLNGPS